MPAAILLAAGESTRMGEPKQLLDWQGQTLVAAQVETLLGAQCRPVIVVLGAHANRVRQAIPGRAEVQIVTNQQWRGGRASSIRAGARAVPPVVDAVAVVSVDQPTRAEVVTRLAKELVLSTDALIAVPRREGRNGHPPVFRAQLLPELQHVTERGGRSSTNQTPARGSHYLLGDERSAGDAQPQHARGVSSRDRALVNCSRCKNPARRIRSAARSG